MKMFKRIKKKVVVGICILSMAMSTFSISNVKAAEYWPSSISVSSGAAIVMELETGTVLYEKEADKSYYPASITKIMTALLSLENCELDETVTFSETAVYENEGDTSHIAREVGEEMTLENALYGMMLESANECAWALGEHTAGSMPAFVDMMNEKAKELGCTHTHFANPNGLPNKDHYVSARDMALIAKEAYSIPKFREMCSTVAYTLPADNKKEAYNLNNSHAMISNNKTSKYIYEYALGGKTGYTDEAGSTLVTFAKKDGMTLVCVVLNAQNPAHYEDTINLFDYCFANFTTYKVADHANINEIGAGVNPGILSEQSKLIRIDSEDVIVLPKAASFKDAKAVLEPAPKDSEAVAIINYKYANKSVGTGHIIYDASNKVSYPFNNVDAENGGSKIKYFRIDFKTILILLLIILLIVGAVYLIYMQSGKILLYRHRKREEKQGFTKQETIKRRKGTQIRRNNSKRKSPKTNNSRENSRKKIKRQNRRRK
ncbi:MAG: D-alanyl-D-alanine carboxypeptidase [Lachnospiraceae bacterium]|nr:D-alanyl-D-alanine carboxypeptidase [Lachnospiraceae bacterium]